jgi:hypothetical protein
VVYHSFLRVALSLTSRFRLQDILVGDIAILEPGEIVPVSLSSSLCISCQPLLTDPCPNCPLCRSTASSFEVTVSGATSLALLESLTPSKRSRTRNASPSGTERRRARRASRTTASSFQAERFWKELASTSSSPSDLTRSMDEPSWLSRVMPLLRRSS